MCPRIRPAAMGLGTLKNPIELTWFESDHDRATVIGEFREQRKWSRRVSFLLCFVVGFLILKYPFAMIFDSLGLGLYFPVTMLLSVVYFLVAMQLLWRRPLQQHLRQELVRRGKPICICCGYDLRGQSEPRCPECSQPFDAGLLKKASPTGEV